MIISIIPAQVNRFVLSLHDRGDVWSPQHTLYRHITLQPARGGERKEKKKKKESQRLPLWQVYGGGHTRAVCSGFGSSKLHNQKRTARLICSQREDGGGGCCSNCCQAAAVRRYSYIHIRLPHPQWSAPSNSPRTSQSTVLKVIQRNVSSGGGGVYESDTDLFPFRASVSYIRCAGFFVKAGDRVNYLVILSEILSGVNCPTIMKCVQGQRLRRMFILRLDWLVLWVHEMNSSQVMAAFKLRLQDPLWQTRALPHDFSTSVFSQIDWTEMELSRVLAKNIITESILFMESIWQLYDKSPLKREWWIRSCRISEK